MREVITSTVVMASSTSRPRAMSSAPSEMRCRSMRANSMIGKMIATVRGIDSATTAPGRSPRLTTLQAMMMAIACQSDVMNSPMAWLTTSGWGDTKGGDLSRREFEIDLLVLRAEHLNLRDVLHLQKLRAHVFDVIA